MRIPTLERYLARQIYGAVGFVLLGFLGLFAFFDLIAELRDLGNGNYQLRQIFAVVALWVPGHAYELLPIAVLIGTLYVLAHLSSNSEYTVMRAAGLSPLRSGAALAKVGLAFVVATFAIGETHVLSSAPARVFFYNRAANSTSELASGFVVPMGVAFSGATRLFVTEFSRGRIVLIEGGF